ncbi:hypothetical protein BG57_03435 [Caballeronia grimmiae]|uniref:Stability/partitioning determinant n=1 Tax=Caballeronia grimmiae TaxID=1071679 RepID=A0A069N9J9_9BURK|nr:hypothetical protein BG57_03435 [Caballeronia grimmiae]
MADLSKLKRRSLPAPPTFDEASENLGAPEHAPVSPVAAKRVDGRSARRSNRTLQFATRVSPEFDERLRSVAQRDGLMLVELLERALDAYEEGKGRA